jgi:hypothetical protein
VTDRDATDSSSLLRPKEHLTQWPDIQFGDIANVRTLTITAFLKDEGIPLVDLIWLDMQGYELHALEAAAHCLDKINRVYMEVSFARLYEGAPLYPEVRVRMFSLGFRVEREYIGFQGGNVLFRHV